MVELWLAGVKGAVTKGLYSFVWHVPLLKDRFRGHRCLSENDVYVT